MKDIKPQIRKGLVLALAVTLQLLVVAAPALSTLIAPSNSVATKSIIKGAVTSAKIKNKTIKNIDIAAGAAIAATKINRAGLDADLLDGKHASDFVEKASPSWSPQTRRYSVPPSAWVRASQNATSADSIASRDSFAYDAAGGDMLAPVYLPDGAKVTEVRLFYTDVSPGGDLKIALFRRSMTTGFTFAWVSQWISSSGSSGALESSFGAISPAHVVDNASNTYFLKAMLTTSARVVNAVVITYTVESPN